MGKFKLSKLIYFLFLGSLVLSSCAKKSEVAQAEGDVLVKIGVQTSSEEYNLKIVQLKGIEKLNEVSGDFARFFYAPGSSENQLTGTSPRAQFIHTQNFFVPSDVISMQMAAIYYHLQNLAIFDKDIGADGVNTWPRSVGLETQISDGSTGSQKNNAFYNGQTDSMMFVPYTNPNLPIAVNAGIIAHEHFHSLFFKLVIRPAFKARKVSTTLASIHAEENVKDQVQFKELRDAKPLSELTEKEKVEMFNETLLRGMNEGLADFWGWVYTDDPEFMRWSLPEYQANRTLTLSENLIGIYETKEKISHKIESTFQFDENPKAKLVNYSYEVGTPYARFLKQLTGLQATAKNIELRDSKKIVAQVVFNYMKELGEQMKALQDGETIDPLSLFNYVAKLGEQKSLVHLDQASCDFLVKYMKLSQCKLQKPTQKGQKDSSFVIVKND